MFTHKQIWLGIDRLAQSKGFSASGLAKQAGLDPTSFNKSKRLSPEGKQRWPSTESLSRILSVTDSTMSDFISLIDEEPENAGEPKITKNMMTVRAAEILIETKSVLFNAKEPFTLKSGKKSPVYIDCRRLISFVEERDTLMDYAARLLREDVGLSEIDVCAGGETAGIPYGAFIADRLRKPMIYVRKQPKGHGRMAQIEGVLPEKIKGKKPKVILIEDLQTDGGSKAEFITALRDAGAEVNDCFVLFHYGIFRESDENMKKLKVRLHALVTWHDVLKAAKKNNYFDKETLASVEAFLDDPHGWQKKHG